MFVASAWPHCLFGFGLLSNIQVIMSTQYYLLQVNVTIELGIFELV